MPESTNPRLKDPELFETLREEGASAEKAARISNAAGARGRSAVGSAGGRAGSYDDWTLADLRRRAKELGITGYSRMRKHEVIVALRQH